MHVIAGVEKVRVGEDGEAGVAQHHSRRTNEEDRAVSEIRGLALWRWQEEFGGVRHSKPPSLAIWIEAVLV
jgi:hypothetical protein